MLNFKNWQYFLDEAAGAGSDDKSGDDKGDKKDEKQGDGKENKNLTAEQKLIAALTPEQKAMYDEALAGQKKALDDERGLNKLGKDAIKKLKTFEDAEAQRKKDELSDVDKAKLETKEANDKLTAAQEALYNTRIRSAVVLEASRLKFADAGDAYNLADLSGTEIAEDGTVSGVKEALEKLAKEKPYLVKGLEGGGTPKSNSKQSVDNGQKPVPMKIRY